MLDVSQCCLTMAFETLCYVFTTRWCHLFALILLAAAFHGRVCLFSILRFAAVTSVFVGRAGTPSWISETGALGSPRFATPRCGFLGRRWDGGIYTAIGLHYVRFKHGMVVCIQLTSIGICMFLEPLNDTRCEQR